MLNRRCPSGLKNRPSPEARDRLGDKHLNLLTADYL